MGKVISLAAAREERSPHWEGTAHCIGCKHEWAAVAPLGTHDIECPNCGLQKGVPKYPFGAQEGDALFICANCDGEALTAYKGGGRFYLRCMGCGIDHTEAVFGG